MKIKTSLIITLFVLMLCLPLTFALDISIAHYDPLPAEAGQPVNVWIKVDNPSDSVKEIGSIRVYPKDGLSLAPGESFEKTLTRLNPRTSQNLKFRLMVDDNAYEGMHILDVDLGKNARDMRKELIIDVKDKDIKDINLAVGNLESDPVRMKPNDDDVKLMVTLQNLGDGSAKGIKAELVDLPKGITLSESYSGTELVGNIAADETAIATYYIDIGENVTPGDYQAQIKLDYKFKPEEDENEYKVEETTIPVRIAIRPVPIYEIEKVEFSKKDLQVDQNNIEMKITIKNIGEEKGESVRIKAYGKTEQPIKFDESSDFIAPFLNPRESGQGTLIFDIKKDAKVQNYYIDLEIKNLVGNDIITYDKKILIPIEKAKENNPFKFVIYGILAIAIAIIYRKVNANKNGKNKIGKAKEFFTGDYSKKLKKKK